MGIFNMMIVIPMLIFGVTLPLFYQSWLGGDPRNVLTLCGVLMLLAAVSVYSVRARNARGLPLGAAAASLIPFPLLFSRGFMTITPAHWSADALAGIAAQDDARMPIFGPADVVPILPTHDLWTCGRSPMPMAAPPFSADGAGGSSWRRRASTIPSCGMTPRASA